MPVTLDIHPDRNLSVVTFSGLFTVEETEAALTAFRAQGGQTHPCMFVFDRPVANFRPENIKRIVSEMAPGSGGRPTAFVGDNDLSFEVCDAIVRFIAQPGRVRAFKTRDEAEAWIRDRLAGKV